MLGEGGDGARHEPAPVAPRIDPVAEIGAPERGVDDVRERDHPGELSLVEDRETQPLLVASGLGLRFEGEELLRPHGIERRHELPVREPKRQEVAGIGEDERPDRHGA